MQKWVGLFFVLIFSLSIGGCTKKASAPLLRAYSKSELVGKYRIPLKEFEEEEYGGWENVPTIFLAENGRWSLTTGEEKFSGTWEVEKESVILLDESTSEKVEYQIKEGGKKLVEPDGGESLLEFVKVESSGSGTSG